MFRFTEQSSGQFLQQSKGTFSDCAHYGIPYCLQFILTLKIMLNSVGRCIISNIYIYIKSCHYIFVKIPKIMLAYVYVFTYHIDIKDHFKFYWPMYYFKYMYVCICVCVCVCVCVYIYIYIYIYIYEVLSLYLC